MVEHPTEKARRNTGMGSSPQRDKGFFSQSGSSADLPMVSTQPWFDSLVWQGIFLTHSVLSAGSPMTSIEPWFDSLVWQRIFLTQSILSAGSPMVSVQSWLDSLM